jgi:hypothetical protein
MRKKGKVYLMREHNCPKMESEVGGKRWPTDNENLADR